MAIWLGLYLGLMTQGALLVLGSDGYFNERTIQDIELEDLESHLSSHRGQESQIMCQCAKEQVLGIGRGWAQIPHSPTDLKVLDDITLVLVYIRPHHTGGAAESKTSEGAASVHEG